MARPKVQNIQWVENQNCVLYFLSTFSTEQNPSRKQPKLWFGFQLDKGEKSCQVYLLKIKRPW